MLLAQFSLTVNKNMLHGPFLPPGTRVRYDGLIEGGPEFGVVIHCWLDAEIDMHDCLVAFFGNEMPSGEPRESPYILRYASTSLVVQPQYLDENVVKPA